jgi:hypothetical protein
MSTYIMKSFMTVHYLDQCHSSYKSYFKSTPIGAELNVKHTDHRESVSN